MLKRRDLLKGAGVASLAGVGAACAASMSVGEDDPKIVEFLFVQNAQGASLAGGKLRMKDVAADTLYFSDRPDRIVGRVTTQEYVDHWSVGGNSFADDPPNAVLSIADGSANRDVVVVLRSPRLEGADLLYDVDVLDGAETAGGGAAALFIDVIGRPMTPMSVAGVHRRRRRAVRRVVR